MERSVKLCFIVVALMVVVTGCATSRGVLSLDVPGANLANPNGKQVFIRSITDNREFQDNPSVQNIPSLGFGGVGSVSAEIKSRAIARKRNTFGKAMGDILLEERQTVQQVIYEATKNSLSSIGYAVVDKQEQAKPEAIVLDISIDKFWAWMTPGFWAISLESEITTTNNIAVPKKEKPIVVMATARNSCQAATDGNWRKAFKMVIDDFIEKAGTALKNFDGGP